MRVLIVAHGFPPTQSAGAERRAERMAHWLLAHNFHVEVFAIEKVDEPVLRLEASEQDGFIVHRLYYNVKEGDDLFRNLYDNPTVGSTLRVLLARQHFDLVHVISGYMMGGQAIHTAHDLGLPVVVTLTEYWFMCARLNLIQATDTLCSGPESHQKCTRCLLEAKRRYRIPAQTVPRLMDAVWPVTHRMALTLDMLNAVAHRQSTLREALNAADLVICPSHYLISKFDEFGFDTTHYLYIRQGLAVPQNEPSRHQQSNDVTLRLGYIGQIKPHKGVELIVDAVIALLNAGEKVSLDIWGKETDPDYSDPIKARANQHPAICWRGGYVGSKVWDVLAALDVVVIPSRWYENSPTVILEAYKMGLPVVATDLGGMAELVEHEKTGMVFGLDDVGDLRVQLERLLHEPGLLDHLRANLPPVKTIDEEMNEIVTHYTRLVES